MRIELTNDVINIWYNKGKQLLNLLCAIGKKSFDDSEDPYFINMTNKIHYLNKIINTFGFKSPIDFKTTIISNSDEKFKKSDIIKNYNDIMKTFGKKLRCKNTEFDMKKFILICNNVLNEFCIRILSKRRKTNSIYYYEYMLIQNQLYLKEIIAKY